MAGLLTCSLSEAFPFRYVDRNSGAGFPKAVD